MIVLMFFVLGSLLIISNNNLALSNQEDVENFEVLLVDWVSKIFENFKSITGNVVRLDWRPE